MLDEATPPCARTSLGQRISKALHAEVGGKRKAKAARGSENGSKKARARRRRAPGTGALPKPPRGLAAAGEGAKGSVMHADLGQLLSLHRQVPAESLLSFLQQMATMMYAGIPILDSLRGLAEEEPHRKLQGILHAMVRDIGNGHAMWEAMASHPRTFAQIYVHIVKAGEATGKLDDAFADAATQMEKAYDTEREVRSALTYPKIILGIAGAIVMGMVLVIIPKLIKAIDNLVPVAKGHKPAPLPVETQILISAAHFLTPPGSIGSIRFLLSPSPADPGLLPRAVLVGLLWVGLGALRRALLRRRLVRRAWDGFKLRCPMKVGPLYTKVIMARFTRGFSSMLHAGVPIQEALGIVAETTGNVIVGDAILSARDSIMAGSTIAQPLKDAGLFPSLVTRAVASGEDTGELEAMLVKVAEHYEKDVEKELKGLTKIIEPMLIIFLGVIVLYVALAFYLAIYSSYMHINGQTP